MENLKVKQSVDINAFKTILSTVKPEMRKEVSENLLMAANAIHKVENAIHVSKVEEERGVVISDLPFISGEYTLWLQLNQMAEIAKNLTV